MSTLTADLYLRLSVDFEGAIERQEAGCRRWCAANGLKVRRVHVDRGISGYSTLARRDGFDAALQRVITREVPTLVVWKLDWLSRRGIGHIGALLDDFERAGGRLVSVQDQLDTAQPQARMIIALLSEFARAESEVIGVRVKSAKEAQRAAGLWLSGKPPFGYAVAPNHRLVPVEPAAKLIGDVFRLIATGHSLTMVCRHLNGRGFRNSRGNPWKTSCLSEAIRTPAYAGLQPARHVAADGRHQVRPALVALRVDQEDAGGGSEPGIRRKPPSRELVTTTHTAGACFHACLGQARSGMNAMSSPAGWRADPSDPRVQRYWDGSTWRAQRAWNGAQWVDTALGPLPPTATPFVVPPTPRHRAWWIGGGVGLGVLAVVIVAAVAANGVGGGGSSGGGGSRQTIGYFEFKANDQLLDEPGLSFLESPGLPYVDATDCRSAASDLRHLRAHTARWPSVLQTPMSQAETEYAAAIRACYANDLGTTQADMSSGDKYAAAADDAFAAHCTQLDQNIYRYQC